MLTLPLPAYPSEQDIRYGLWIKHFAIHLPPYANRYGLSILQLLEIRSMAGEYLDLLTWRLQHTSASIVRRRQPTLALADAQAIAREAASHQERAQAIRDVINLFVAHVQCHPAYTACDGQALQLTTRVV